MSDLLRAVLRDAASEGSPPHSVDALHASLVRRRRRRFQLRSAASIASVVAAAVTVALVLPGGRTAHKIEPSVVQPPGGGWTSLPPSPLSPRRDAIAAVVGKDVLVIGGTPSAPCGPAASCTLPVTYKDAAAYDTVANRWRAIAPAPEELTSGPVAVTGGVVHLLQFHGRHLAYDVSQDRWTERASPRRADFTGNLVAAGPDLIAYSDGSVPQDQVYDEVRDTWSDLPVSPLAPSFNRSLVWTGTELVEISAEKVPDPGREPAYARAAVLDLGTRTWRRLPDATTIIADGGWSWDGHQLVNPSQVRVDGGKVNGYGKEVAVGGALDPVTGQWSALPVAPPLSQTAFGVEVSGLRYQAFLNGVYDSQTRLWSLLPEPPPSVHPFGSDAWFGDALFVWGGAPAFTPTGGGGAPVATGGIYRPVSPPG